MKLLYTDVRTSLTKILTHQATKLAVDKQVFYLAPNSLSFEKEREVLRYISNQSTFSITVTGFKQLARYILPSGYPIKKGLDNIGLGMVFYKCLSELDSEAFNIYGELKQDRQFIQQLINLYHDMISAQMDFTDLEKLDDEAKRKDLILIFDKVTSYLNNHQLALGSPLTSLIEALESNEISVDFSQFAFVIDGFTRFSAEEEYIIKLLHRKGSEIVIGCYASKKALSHPLLEGNLYQASIEFLNGLSREFQTKVEDYTVKHDERDVFEQVSRKIESSYDFSEDSGEIDTNQEQLQIWSCMNQKEELELIARDIRQKLNDNSDLRYKHFRILLGDVDSYHLSLKTIFDQYKIPVYFAKSEYMSHHSLAQFVESILRLKRYHFRQEDLLNLLKTGLYTNLSQEDIDAFEQYVHYLDINGLAAFEKTFTKSHEDKFDVNHLDDIRKQVLSPLVKLLSTSSLSSEQMLQQWSNFLKEAGVTQNLESLSQNLDPNAKERQLEVWKAFIQIQYQFATVFETSKTTIEDFLALLHSGISLSRYRTIPATVDTVLVQSYDLISPLTSYYIYALGLTQDNFPKIAQNNGLLSDEERYTLNQVTGENSKLPIVSRENLKKSRYTFVSLLNSARKQLVLSSPSLLKEGESKPSKYFNELNVLFSNQAKIINSKKISKEDVGSYHSLLSSLVAYHQQVDKIEEGEDLTFMKVLARVMSKKLQSQGLENPALPTVPTSQPLSSETLSALYPSDKDFYLSVSALTEFYKNEYSYFLVYVLKLQEDLRLRPDARNHGMFLHRIFELVMGSDQNPSFDKRLEEAIDQAIQEEKFSDLYHEKSETRFTQEVLLDIVHTVAPVLKNNDVVEAIQQEAKFGGNRQPFLQLENGRNIFIRGQIDRIDCLKGINPSESSPIGIVDYKSSDTRFDYRKFYNGLNSQLPTYLSVLQKERTEPLFGAMYLPMMEKIESLPLDVSKLKGLQYQGLFLEQQAQNLGGFYNHNEANQLSDDELQLLLDYNLYLYKKAAERILSGQYLINPYSEDGKTIASYAPQYQAITGFEANLHLGQARVLERLDKTFIKEKLKKAWLQKIREELDK